MSKKIKNSQKAGAVTPVNVQPETPAVEVTPAPVTPLSDKVVKAVIYLRRHGKVITLTEAHEGQIEEMKEAILGGQNSLGRTEKSLAEIDPNLDGENLLNTLITMFPSNGTTTGRPGRKNGFVIPFHDLVGADGTIIEGTMDQYNREVRDVELLAGKNFPTQEALEKVITFLNKIDAALAANGGHANRPLGSAWSTPAGLPGPLYVQITNKIAKWKKAIDADKVATLAAKEKEKADAEKAKLLANTTPSPTTAAGVKPTIQVKVATPV